MGEFADYTNSTLSMGRIRSSEKTMGVRKVCRNCGFTPLFWKHTDTGWRLSDVSDKIHYCYDEIIESISSPISEAKEALARLKMHSNLRQLDDFALLENFLNSVE